MTCLYIYASSGGVIIFGAPIEFVSISGSVWKWHRECLGRLFHMQQPLLFRLVPVVAREQVKNVRPVSGIASSSAIFFSSILQYSILCCVLQLQSLLMVPFILFFRMLPA